MIKHFLIILIFLISINNIFSYPSELDTFIEDNNLNISICNDFYSCNLTDIRIFFFEEYEFSSYDGDEILVENLLYIVSKENSELKLNDFSSIEGLNINSIYIDVEKSENLSNFLTSLSNLEVIFFEDKKSLLTYSELELSFPNLKRVYIDEFDPFGDYRESYDDLFPKEYFSRNLNYEIPLIYEDTTLENFLFMKNSKAVELSVGVREISSLEGLSSMKNLKKLTIEVITEETFNNIIYDYDTETNLFENSVMEIPTLKKIYLDDDYALFMTGGLLNWEGCQEIANGNSEYEVKPENLCHSSIEINISTDINASVNTSITNDPEDEVEEDDSDVEIEVNVEIETEELPPETYEVEEENLTLIVSQDNLTLVEEKNLNLTEEENETLIDSQENLTSIEYSSSSIEKKEINESKVSENLLNVNINGNNGDLSLNSSKVISQTDMSEEAVVGKKIFQWKYFI